MSLKKRCIYTGKVIGNHEVILANRAVEYVRKLGYLVSNVKFLFIALFLVGFVSAGFGLDSSTSPHFSTVTVNTINITGVTDTFVLNYSDYLNMRIYALNNSLWSLNYSDYLNTKTYALNDSRWSLNFSNFSVGWYYAINSSTDTDTFVANYSAFLVTQNYALNGSLWSLNYTNFTKVHEYALNNTLIKNSSLTNFYLTNGTGGAYFYHNGTGWVIKG